MEYSLNRTRGPIETLDQLPWPLAQEARLLAKAEGKCEIETIALALITFLPQVGPLALTGAFAGFGTGSALIAQALAYTVVGGALFTASHLLNKPPGAQKPQDGQIVTRQALPPRRRSYGKVKLGGALGFQQQRVGDLWQEILHGQCEINQITERWLGDKQITIDGSGWVTTAPWNGGQIIRIENMLGAADQAAFADLVSTFAPAYTENVRWRGVPKTLIRYKGVKAEDIAKYYGAGVPPYRQVHESALVYDPTDEEQIAAGDPDRPRDAGWTYSDNAGRVILDYMRHPDGFRRVAPVETRRMVPIEAFYLPEWIGFINCSDEDVPLKGGGTTKRWRLAGTYELTQDPKDVLQGMCDACDAEVYIRPDCKIGIRGGRWIAPTTTIEEKYILAHQLRPGAGKLSGFNRLNVKYVSPAHDYQETDADPWRDQANITLRGEELVKPLSLLWCPAHNQARRIAKIATAKGNPPWQGPVKLQPWGLNLLGKGTSSMQYAEYGIDRTFHVSGFRPSSDLSVVDVTVAALGAADYVFDPDAEEGTEPPVPESTAGDGTIPFPTDVGASILIKLINGVSVGYYMLVTWTASEILTLSVEGRYRESDGAGGWFDWQTLDVSSEAPSAVSGLLNEGKQYGYQLRALSPIGRPSLWSPEQFITASAPPFSLDMSRLQNSGYRMMGWI